MTHTPFVGKLCLEKPSEAWPASVALVCLGSSALSIANSLNVEFNFAATCAEMNIVRLSTDEQFCEVSENPHAATLVKLLCSCVIHRAMASETRIRPFKSLSRFPNLIISRILTG
jgi:hypothetical protein